MLNYNQSKIVGVNPTGARNRLGAILTYGLNVTGIAEPAQATNGVTDGAAVASVILNLDKPLTNIFRWIPIIGYVADWPWATDEIGVAFDQSNLWAVRTRACVAGLQGEGGDGGEVDWWTAVPKTLPSGYTFKGRTGLLSSGISADYLGAMPLFGPCTYNTSLDTYAQSYALWREPTLVDGFYSGTPHQFYEWMPSNLSRCTLPIGTPSAWYTTNPGPTQIDYYIGHLGQPANLSALRHVGFRGGRYTASGGGTGPANTSVLYIGWTGYSNQFPTDLSQITITQTVDITALSGNQSLGSCLAPTPAAGGINARKWWHAVIKYSNGTGGTGAFATGIKMSPRTDIPAWFTCVTGNRVAPGGVIT